MKCTSSGIAILCLIQGILGNNLPLDPQLPEWSPTYSVEGILSIPYAEIEEPFAAFGDLDNGKSRIDYYGNTDRTYQRQDIGQYGLMFKLVPMTNEQVTNQINCFEVKGSEDSPVTTQSILPSLQGFTLKKNNDVKDGQDCEKWQKIEKIGEKVNKYTMWLNRVPSEISPDLEMVIPVHYEMKGYNTLLGSHYDHYYLTYVRYSPEKPSHWTFERPKGMKCHGFPGPGVQAEHIYSMNPAKEFIDGHSNHVDATFSHWKTRHSKQYTDGNETNMRKDIYRQNMRYIHSTNRQHLSYSLASNHLADLTDSEMKFRRGKLKSSGSNGGLDFRYSRQDLNGAPESLDWRLYGAVSQVKDQASCGSCWSFGTVGTLEGALFLKTGRMTRLSQQALVDCSWGFGNNGCDGGEDFRSYQWIMKHNGIPTEDSYGNYLGIDGFCHLDDPATVMGLQIKNYVNVTSGDLDAVKVAIAKHGPLSVGIDAAHKSLSFYSSGVYFEPKCGNTLDDLDHAVLAVGYGEIMGEKFWLIKNSWSNYWGNDGYVLMSQKDNNCGVATAASYVNLK